MGSEQLKQLLQELKAEYITALPSKINYLQEVADGKDLELLISEYHKLKGTGKTYGLPEVSVVAGLLEQHLTEHPEDTFLVHDTAMQLLRDIQKDYAAQIVFDLYAHPNYQKLIEMRRKL